MPTDAKSCDVLIVGAGPAGLSVASHLPKSVMSIVVHQDAEIGKPVRTSGGSWVRDIEALKIPRHLYQVIDQLDFFSDNEEARFTIKTDRMAVLQITDLYRYLATLSDHHNRELLLSTKFLDVEKQTDGTFLTTVRSRDEGTFQIRSAYIVDASGWQSAVIGALGLGQKPERQGVGIEYEFPRADFARNRAILFVGGQALTGYGWVFPTPDDRIRLGIGVINPDTDLTPRNVMDAFLEQGLEKRYGLTIPSDYEVNAGVIPSVAYDPKLVWGNVVRTGDAANFATPTVGEGIRIAIEYGRLLGTELGESLNGNSQALTRYEQRAAREFQRDYKYGLMMNKRIAGYPAERWDKSVKRLQRLSERDVTQMVRSKFSVQLILRTIALSVLGKLCRN